jgi:hypothetical protein
MEDDCMIYGYYEDRCSDVCICCGEVLWVEFGYWSENEELLWEFFYYPNMYGWDMGLSHYRRDDDYVHDTSIEDVEIEEIFTEIEEVDL